MASSHCTVAYCSVGIQSLIPVRSGVIQVPPSDEAEEIEISKQESERCKEHRTIRNQPHVVTHVSNQRFEVSKRSDILSWSPFFFKEISEATRLASPDMAVGALMGRLPVGTPPASYHGWQNTVARRWLFFRQVVVWLATTPLKIRRSANVDNTGTKKESVSNNCLVWYS